MNVIRVDRTGGPAVLVPATSDVPKAGDGELLIRQTAAGVNYIDVYLRTGAYPHALPVVPGREGVGVVEAIGRDVAGFRPGMRVAYPESPNLVGYAEYVTVPARTLQPLPEGLGFHEAAVAMRHVSTAWNLLVNIAKLQAGEWVFIMGASGNLGSIGIQIAKNIIGANVIAAAGSRERAHALD